MISTPSNAPDNGFCTTCALRKVSLAMHKHSFGLFFDKKIDVINVNARAGSDTLKDAQRRSLLTNLLQSSSQARLGYKIGDAYFLLSRSKNRRRVAPGTRNKSFHQVDLLQSNPCRQTNRQPKTAYRQTKKHKVLLMPLLLQSIVLRTQNSCTAVKSVPTM